MRVAVFADVHGNAGALEGVMRAAVDADVAELWSLGDVLGPGPDGARAVALVRSYCRVALIGNHDREAEALAALDDDDRAWLRSRKPAARRAGVQCWHGSPRHPVHEYVTAANAGDCLARQRGALGLVGHTHEAAAWRALPAGGGAERVAVAVDEPRDLAQGKWLLNPGAVAAGAWWLELDLDALVATWRRAPFDPGRIRSAPWKATSSATGTGRGTGSSASSTPTRSTRRS